MNLVTVTINDLSEVDFDDLFERSKDALAANWPTASVMTDEEKKAGYISCITSGFNNEWPGLNPHGPNDVYVGSKHVDLDTGLDMGLVAGFVLPDGTFDGRHSMSAPDANGSRNWLYSERFRELRNDWYASIGATKTLYRNIVANSMHYRHIKMRAGLHFEIIEDVESPTMGPNFRNVTVEYK